MSAGACGGNRRRDPGGARRRWGQPPRAPRNVELRAAPRQGIAQSLRTRERNGAPRRGRQMTWRPRAPQARDDAGRFRVGGRVGRLTDSPGPRDDPRRSGRATNVRGQVRDSLMAAAAARRPEGRGRGQTPRNLQCQNFFSSREEQVPTQWIGGDPARAGDHRARCPDLPIASTPTGIEARGRFWHSCRVSPRPPAPLGRCAFGRAHFADGEELISLPIGRGLVQTMRYQIALTIRRNAEIKL